MARTNDRGEGHTLRRLLGGRRILQTLLGSVLATLACGTAIAQADGTIGAVGINSIQSDGILLPNNHWDGLGDLNLLQQSSVQLYRARVQLNCVDPNHTGQFNFSNPSSSCYGLSYDNLVGALANRGITLLPVLMNFNGGVPQPPTPDGANGSPTIAEFAAFAHALVARYGPSGSYWPTCDCTPQPIHAWEIWNEENNGYWWAGDSSASAYGAVLAATKAALRSVDPQARIVVGGIVWDADGESSFVPPAQFLQQLTATNANAFDAVAVHPYTDDQGQSPTQLAAAALAYVNQTAADLIQDTGPSTTGGPRQQIWVTEMGWSDTLASPATIAAGFQDFMADVQGGARTTDNIGPVLWYMLRDNATITTRDDGLGMRYTNSDGSDAGAKPIWSVFVNAAQTQGTIPLPAALSDSGPYVHGTTAAASGSKTRSTRHAKRASVLRCVRSGKHHHGARRCTHVARPKGATRVGSTRKGVRTALFAE